jgi:hypothetical protein
MQPRGHSEPKRRKARQSLDDAGQIDVHVPIALETSKVPPHGQATQAASELCSSYAMELYNIQIPLHRLATESVWNRGLYCYAASDRAPQWERRLDGFDVAAIYCFGRLISTAQAG